MSEKLYETLGVKEDATPKDIKRAWRKLAKKLHPDNNNGLDGDFKKAERAFSILSDPVKRRRYDEYGETSAEQALDRLGDFMGHICNPQHTDYILQPLKELKHMLVEFGENLKATARRRKIIRVDWHKLVDSDRAEEMEVPITALDTLYRALADSIVRIVECKEKCVELIEQYTIAQEVVGRGKEGNRKKHMFSPEALAEAMLGGKVTTFSFGQAASSGTDT